MPWKTTIRLITLILMLILFIAELLEVTKTGLKTTSLQILNVPEITMIVFRFV